MAHDDPHKTSARPHVVDETLDSRDFFEKIGLSATVDSEAVVAASPLSFGPRFEVISRLGAGGMGEVYKVRDCELDEIVALKTLRAELLDDPRSALRFRREVKLARRVTHPNVARIFDLRVEGEVVFLTMEYIDGASLGEVLAEQAPLAWNEVARLGAAICEGLAAAHRADVVHRDLKPDNVMIADGGRAVITDFGIATSATRGITTTDLISGKEDAGEASEGMVGTPYYISPEQARSLPVDARADIYALGCMLWEMLTGRPAWQGSTLMELVMKRLIEPPPPLPADLAVPEAMQRIVSRCMARDRNERPSSAAQLASALEDIRETSTASPTLTFAPFEQPATNLSPRPTAFVGRLAERRELAERLADDEQRLVSLLGPGGTGKTRLSQEYGVEHLASYPGGVWFCDLSLANSAEEICEVVAQMLDVPLPASDQGERLGRAIGGRGRMLLILDNLEQVVEPVAELLSAWIAAAPLVKFIATSRVRLGLQSEQLMPIDPLDVDSAVELFERRARQVRPRFSVDEANRATVVEIVRRVDGLPLAVELAAAQMRMLDAERLLARLDDRFRALRSSHRDRPRRHLSMRNVLDGSWELLSAPARLALAQLSVFRGGATLEAACRVIDLDHFDDAPWPEEALEELWDHSLVRWSRTDTDDRLVLLESVQAYAAEKLECPQPVYARHARVFAELGEPEAEQAYHTAQSAELLANLCAERDNLRFACQRSIEAGLAGEAVLALRAFDVISQVRGQHDVALAEAVAQMPQLDEPSRVAALQVLAKVYQRTGRPADCERVVSEAVRLAEGFEMAREVAQLEYLRASCRWYAGDFEAARNGLLEVWRQFSELGERRHQGLAAERLGLTLWNLGELDEALSWQRKAVEILREVGDRRAVGTALMGMGLVHVDRGEFDEGCELYAQALAIHRELDDHVARGLVITNMAAAHSAQGHTEQAERLWTDALEIHRKTGDERAIALVRLNLGVQDMDAGRLAEGKRQLERALETFQSIGERRLEGITLGSLAVAHAHEGRTELAARNFDAAESKLRAVSDRFGLARLLCKRGLFDLSQGLGDAARARLDEATQIRDQLAAGPGSFLAESVAQLQHALDGTSG